MNFESIVEKFGIPGVTVIILLIGIKWGAVFVKDLMKQHKEEREEWRKSQERRDEDYNKSLNNNTNALSRLNTLIETLKK